MKSSQLSRVPQLWKNPPSSQKDSLTTLCTGTAKLEVSIRHLSNFYQCSIESFTEPDDSIESKTVTIIQNFLTLCWRTISPAWFQIDECSQASIRSSSKWNLADRSEGKIWRILRIFMTQWYFLPNPDATFKERDPNTSCWGHTHASVLISPSSSWLLHPGSQLLQQERWLCLKST